MFKLLRYLPLVGKFQDVSEAYKAETGKERPAYLSRRFVGAVIGLATKLAIAVVELIKNADMAQENKNALIARIKKAQADVPVWE